MRTSLLSAVFVILAGCAVSTGLPDAAPMGDAEHLGDASETSRDGGLGDASRAIDAGASDASASTDGASAHDAAAHDAAAHDAAAPPLPTDEWPGTNALLRPSSPMPCADPSVISEGGARHVYYVFCTGMSHVWTTSNWVDFRDVRSSTTFDLTGISTNGAHIGSWWAPGVIFVPALSEYVMWVSVPDANGTDGADGWTARSLAVLTSPAPTGPWRFRALAANAAAGQMFIDPFPFVDADGGRYVYWKQYGGGLSSSIMGARVDATWTGIVTGSRMEVMHGYGGTGTWEDNVRENPAVLRDSAGHHHLIFSGGHYRDDSYATGHALSTCGPLCPSTTSGGWHMVDSGDRGILQVVRATGSGEFALGGPGGAVFLNDRGDDIVFAAAARHGESTRFLMRDRVSWQNRAPFVDTTGHHPVGF